MPRINKLQIVLRAIQLSPTGLLKSTVIIIRSPLLPFIINFRLKSVLVQLLIIDTPRFMHLTLIILKLSQDPEFNKKLNRRRDEQTGNENKMMCILYTSLPIYFSSFKVIKGSRFLAHRRTDRLTDGGKPIVPSGVNTGRRLITNPA